jgi:hypothetical protein
MLSTTRIDLEKGMFANRNATKARALVAALLAVAAITLAAGADDARETERATTSAPADTSPTSTDSYANQIRGFQLIDEQHGWIQRGDTVAFTADGGQSWRDLNPPTGTTAVGFLDADRAVAATADLSVQKATLWFSKDSGATFTNGTEIEALTPIYGLSVDLTSDGSLRLLVQFQSGSSFNFGELFASKDGLAWDQIPGAPSGGQVRFTDALHGVILGGSILRQAWATDDGGATWNELLVLPAPTVGAYFPPAVIVETSTGISLGTSKSESNTSPTFQVAQWTVNDAQAARVATATSEVEGQTLALTPQGRLLVIGSTVVESLDSSGAVRSEAAANLGGAVVTAQFASDSVGWALRNEGHCIEKKDCTLVSQVMITRDGGRTWTAAGK